MGETITTGITIALDLCTQVLDFITGNALLAVLLVCGTLIPCGIGVFRKVKRAAK